jgi:hypothetical protein
MQTQNRSVPKMRSCCIPQVLALSSSVRLILIN